MGDLLPNWVKDGRASSGGFGGSGVSPRVPGWWRWVGMGGGIVVLVMLIALLVSMLSAGRLMRWGLGRMTARIMATLPDGTPEPVRSALDQEFGCVLAAAEDGSVGEARLGEFARACMDALADAAVSPDELERIDGLARAMCAASGRVSSPVSSLESPDSSQKLAVPPAARQDLMEWR